MERREFIRRCGAGIAAGATASPLAAAMTAHFYARTRLVDPRGAPLRASRVPVQKNLVFNFPFASTPCFLLNLGRPATQPVSLKTANNETYRWTGGVGPTGSIVAYSAICAHQLAYPTREISFISYRAEASARNRHAHVIHCCAEHSQYDPAEGARVVAGPAPQPLAAILLEYAPGTDELTAVGTLGGEMFNQFFAKYAFKLSMEHGDAARKAVSGTAVVEELDNYCRQQVRC